MKNKIRWALAGCKNQSRQILRELVSLGFIPEFVCTMKSAGSDDNKEMSHLCNTLSIPLYFSENLTELSSKLQSLDLLLVCRFNILKEKVFSLPKLGSVNIHNSLLPKYPGVHPVSWAIINAEKDIGVTLHIIDSGIDTGPILKQDLVQLREFMSIHLINSILDEMAAGLVLKFFSQLNNEMIIKLQPKFDNKTVNNHFYAHRRNAEDSIVSSSEIHLLPLYVKALPEPFPSAKIDYKGERYIVNNAIYTELTFDSSLKPLEVIETSSACTYLINTSPNQILLCLDTPVLKIGSTIND